MALQSCHRVSGSPGGLLEVFCLVLVSINLSPGGIRLTVEGSGVRFQVGGWWWWWWGRGSGGTLVEGGAEERGEKRSENPEESKERVKEAEGER